MDGWVDYLHFDFLGEHILFDSLQLHSFWAFFLSCVLISVVCFSERFLTAVLNKDVRPRWSVRSRLASASWRSFLYGLVTFLRLLYMLLAMSYQVGIIAVVVITLSIGQFAIEYMDYQHQDYSRQAEEPLLGAPEDRVHVTSTRSRARSQPEAIFIHPYESNLARADAVALELGIIGDTDLVKGVRPPDQQESWQHGKGRDVARKLFGTQHPRSTDSNVFEIGNIDEDRTP